MEITRAEFISSHASVDKCPPPEKPEFAFIGRSNVGKSSLVNMLTNRKNLAKTSSTPGKTQTINHFLINDDWYLVDLPGYGFASGSKERRGTFGKIIESYILKRDTLFCLFILIDCRHEPQGNDLDFIRWCGTKEIPFCIVFTKADKLSPNELRKSIQRYERVLLEEWSELPPRIVTSALSRHGKDDVLNFIEDALASAR